MNSCCYFVFYMTICLFMSSCSLVVGTNTLYIKYLPFETEVSKKNGCQIYCINSSESVGLTNIWKTIKVQAVCKTEENESKCSNPGVIVGENEAALQGSCTRGWLPRYSPWERNYASLSPFKDVCFAVVHDSIYKLNVVPYSIYLNYNALFVFGLSLFICAPALSQNLLFYYSSGITIGVFASLLILVYILSRMIPKKTGAFTVLAVGWSGVLCILHWLFENFTDVNYQHYVLSYISISALISFAVCYYYGPSYHERAQKIVQWTIQLCALICIHQSTHDANASLAMVLGLLIVVNLPFGFILGVIPNFQWKWNSKKRPRFLTEQEYEEQARKETKIALEELRQQCLSPQVETWKTVSRLESPKRFARFVLGDSHLSGDEINAYDSDISLVEDDDDTADTSDVMTDDMSFQEEAVII